MSVVPGRIVAFSRRSTQSRGVPRVVDRRLVKAVAAAVVLIAVTVPVSAAIATPDPPSGTVIVWSSDRAGTSGMDLWRMDPADPTIKDRLTDEAGDELFPIWSPDGRRVAFWSNPGNSIWVIDAYGVTEPIQVSGAGSGPPFFWSPDGSRIYYSSGGLKWTSADDDLSEQSVGGAGSVCQPDLSPNGIDLVFFDCGGGDRELRTATLSLAVPGSISNVQDLFPNAGDSDVCGSAATREVTLPTWSPDGLHIAFGRDTAHFVNNPNVVAHDGTGCFEVFDPPVNQYAPNAGWSPDSMWLTFDSRQGQSGTTDVYIVPTADDTGLVNLTSDGFSDRDPDWTTDPGTAIVWASDRDGGTDLDLWRMNPADPGAKVQITDYPGDETYPLWSPDATTIAFNRGAEASNAIWVVDANGIGPPIQLTPNGSGINPPFFWSDDGQRVYFVRGSSGLKWVSITGDLVEHTVSGGENVCQPDGSRRDSRVVFFACGGGDKELLVGTLSDPSTLTGVMDLFSNPADSDVCGSDPTREVTLPAWSPDASRIAFGRDTAHFVNNPNVVASDGTGCFQVFDPPLNQYAPNPRWSPGGRQLTFESRTGPSGTTDVYVVRVDDHTTLMNLTNDAFSDRHPDWAVDVDDTPPVVTGVPDRAPNTDDWYNADVVIDWTATDPSPSSGPPTDPADTLASTEGADVPYVSDPSCDPAGNCGMGTLSLNIDKTAPSVTGAASPAPNVAGWNNTDVTVTFTCTDTLSGIDQCTGPMVLATDGTGQSATGHATDVADNTAQATVDGIDIDKTPPAVLGITVDTNPKGVSEPTNVTAAVSDNLSGVVEGEYFLGADPGVGNGIAMSLSGSSLIGLVDDTVPVGVHSLFVRSRDAADNWSDTTAVILVVYDPSGGFATGGGWITPRGSTSDPNDVLPGICTTEGACTAKANFGFVVKYQNGASTVPGGNLEFHYNVSQFHVRSADMEWLVVTNSNWAHFQGSATIDGVAGLHPFRVDARDTNKQGQPDRFVIRLWAPGADPDVDEPLYKASGDVEGGQVKIHT